jgi:hypothetical protein
MTVLAGLKQACPWARFGFPGLALNYPHRDLEWLDICRDAILASDWLGCHTYWQYDNMFSADWGLRFVHYRQRFPSKMIEITELGNSTPNLARDAMAAQYAAYYQRLQQYPYIASASSFLCSSPDPTWLPFAWCDPRSNTLFPVVAAVGALPHLPPPPEPVYSVAYLSHDVPANMTPRQSASLTLRLRNDGNVIWPSGGQFPVRLGHRWLPAGLEGAARRHRCRTKRHCPGADRSARWPGGLHSALGSERARRRLVLGPRRGCARRECARAAVGGLAATLGRLGQPQHAGRAQGDGQRS